MSTYVPGYQHDIFVSYAPVDDEPLMGIGIGWVTTLIIALKVLLDQKLGYKEAFSYYPYHIFVSYVPLAGESLDVYLRRLLFLLKEPMPATSERDKQMNDAALERAKQLDSAATFLLILSPAYLTSPQCLSELRTFLKRVGQDSRRVFVVEYDKVEQRPRELSDLLGYRFWENDVAERTQTFGFPKPVPDKDSKYYRQLTYLCGDLSKELKYLREQIEERERRKIEENKENERRKKEERRQKKCQIRKIVSLIVIVVLMVVLIELMVWMVWMLALKAVEKVDKWQNKK